MRRPLPLIIRRLLIMRRPLLLLLLLLLLNLRLKQCTNLQIPPRLDELLLILLLLIILPLLLPLLLLLLPESETLSLVLNIMSLVSLRRRLEPQPHPL
jgi:hypothetical protein